MSIHKSSTVRSGKHTFSRGSRVRFLWGNLQKLKSCVTITIKNNRAPISNHFFKDGTAYESKKSIP